MTRILAEAPRADAYGGLDVAHDLPRSARLARSGQTYVCAAAAHGEGTWHHFGMNFGAPRTEVFVDGAQLDFTGDFVVEGRTQSCGGSEPRTGLDGNDLDWGIGRNLARTPLGGPPLPQAPFFGGFDHLRISRVRRDYASRP